MFVIIYGFMIIYIILVVWHDGMVSFGSLFRLIKSRIWVSFR
jgi:hypothetical protein